MEDLKVLYISRAFLDYRIPVFEELDKLYGENLYVFYSKKLPERVWVKLEEKIDSRAVGFSGEYVLGYKGNITKEMANSFVRIPIQPGLFREINKIKPNIIITDGFSEWSLVGLFYSIVKRVPLVICYERTFYTERNSQWYRRLFRKTVLRFVDAMCVNGVLSKEYAQSLGVNLQQITTGHMVSDTKGLTEAVESTSLIEIEKAKNHYNINGRTKIFLSIGQLINRKGIDYLLRAWAKFQGENGADATLLIVGDGPERENLKVLAQNLGSNNVVFAGHVDYDQIHIFYAMADIFVISTLEDNWSLVVPEAMSCKKPIFCSKYNGCWPELVEDGCNGYVFDPFNLDETASSFSKFMLEDTVLIKMGKESFKKIEPYTPASAALAIKNACDIAVLKRSTKI